MIVRSARRPAAALLAAVAAALAVSVTGGAGHAAPPPTGPVEFAEDDPAFFAVPDPMPTGEHGDLLRFQVVDDPFNDIYRIMYLSETVAGTPTVVTGLVAAPEDRAPFGGYPVLLFGHGALGMADTCAPSRTIGGEDVFGPADFDTATTATNAGFVVAATDYEGLGGPGVHPYLVGVSEGRSMLDAGRAARQIPGVYGGSRTATLGFSQGGHAAIFATELAATWTPEQPIAATLLAAPGTEVGEYVRLGVADPSLAAGAVATVTGLAAADPGAAAALPTVLTPGGQEVAGLLADHCFDEQIAMPGGPLLAADPTTVEPFAALIAAQTPGTATVATPYFIVQSQADTNVPLAWSDALVARLCAAGNQVGRELIADTPHGATLSVALRDQLGWLAATTAGTPPAFTSACAAG